MMKYYILLLFVLLGYNQSQAQVLTDWQTENLRGKVKTLISIDYSSEGKEAKKQIVHFDERGFFTLKEIYIGVQEGDEETPMVYTKIGELQFFEYQEGKRRGMSLNPNGTKATEFTQEWTDTKRSTLTYTYFNKPENKGEMQLIYSDQAQVKEIHLVISEKKEGQTVFETKSIHDYDGKGYEVQLTQKTLQPYGDTQVLTLRNTIFDSQGNIVEKATYDENMQPYSKTSFQYEYYE